MNTAIIFQSLAGTEQVKQSWPGKHYSQHYGIPSKSTFRKITNVDAKAQNVFLNLGISIFFYKTIIWTRQNAFVSILMVLVLWLI